ncbi:MAG: leucine-rich repeat protein [Erysipelothrix sp.]|nr:leucine-rich repeat protein [Erysipelothrix sp.]
MIAEENQQGFANTRKRNTTRSILFVLTELMTVCLVVFTTSCTIPEEDFVIKIPDTNLESTVREMIRKPTGEIMKSDVSEIESLASSFGGISSIDGLEHFENLKYLILNDNRIASIAPLAKLTKLKQLVLSGNLFIDDLAPLKKLQNLTILKLSNNSVTDITPLKNLNKLQYLNLEYNKITSVAPLGTLKSLKTLNIGNNPIKDHTSLKDLVNTKIVPPIVTELRNGLISTINHSTTNVSFLIDRDVLPMQIRNFTNIHVTVRKISRPDFNDAFNAKSLGLELVPLATNEKYDDEKGFSLYQLEPGTHNVLIVLFDQNIIPVGYFEKIFEIPDYDIILQTGNEANKSLLQTFNSNELEDNRLMNQFNSFWLYFNEGFSEDIAVRHGFKRIILSMEHGDFAMVQWDKPELSIRPDHDREFSHIIENGVEIVYVLGFWDKAYINEGNDMKIPRFTTQEEIDRYLEFVRFSVNHFKGRIKYYEFWNEPNIGDTIQHIKPENYVNVVKQAIPIIRAEDPKAKIIIGGVAGIGSSSTGIGEEETYLLEILKPEILPYVDVISWHPWTSGTIDKPGIDNHLDEYLNFIRNVKKTAEANGFTGEYFADELNWQGKVPPHDSDRIHYDDDIAAKFHIRGSIMHLGLDISVGYIYIEGRNPIIQNTIRNINALMSGVVPYELPIIVDTKATKIMHHGFIKSNGDRMIAIWSEIPPASKYIGSESTIFIPGITTTEISAIDLLYGFEQQLNFRKADGGIYIDNLFISDYPLLIKLSSNKP